MLKKAQNRGRIIKPEVKMPKMKVFYNPTIVKSKDAGRKIVEFTEAVFDLEDEDSIKNLVTQHVHTFNQFEGRSTKAAYRGMWGIGMDFDNGINVEEAIERLGDLTYVLYTSTSHKPEHHKFRVLLPMDPEAGGPYYTRQGDAEVVLNWVKKWFPEVDPATLLTNQKWFPCTGAGKEHFRLVVNVGKWLEVKEEELLDTDQGEKLTVKHTYGAWKRPTPLTPDEVFNAPGWANPLTLDQVREKLQDIKAVKNRKMIVYCPRCDDGVNGRSASGVMRLTALDTVSLYCSHCHSVGDGLGGKGVYLERKVPLYKKEVYIYQNLGAMSTPWWVERNEDGDWVANLTTGRKALEYGYDPESLPFFEGFALDGSREDGEVGVLDRGAVVFNAMRRSKWRPQEKVERVLSAEDSWKLFKEKCPYLYACFHNIVGEKEAEVWMMNWLGALLDHRQLCTVPILAGNGGIGKSYFFEQVMGEILGKRFVQSFSGGEIVEDKFASADAEVAWLCVCNEIRITGGTEDKMKALLTNPSILIEKKGMTKYAIPNRRAYIFTTNRGNAVKMSANERRYMVCVPPDGGIPIMELIGDMGLSGYEELWEKEKGELGEFASILEGVKYQESELTTPKKWVANGGKEDMEEATDNAWGMFLKLMGGDEELVDELTEVLLNDGGWGLSDGLEDIQGAITGFKPVVREYDWVKGLLMDSLEKGRLPRCVLDGVEKVVGQKMVVIKKMSRADLVKRKWIEWSHPVSFNGKLFRCVVANVPKGRLGSGAGEN